MNALSSTFRILGASLLALTGWLCLSTQAYALSSLPSIPCTGIKIGTPSICAIYNIDGTNAKGQTTDKITSITLSGDTAEFTIDHTASTCSVGTVTTAFLICRVFVIYTPTSLSTKTATLTVNDTLNHPVSQVTTGTANGSVATCSETETPVCWQTNPATGQSKAVASSFCGTPTPVSATCTSGSCAACSSNLFVSRYITFITNPGVGGRSGKDSIAMALSDQLGNSCGACNVALNPPYTALCPTGAWAAVCGAGAKVDPAAPNGTCTYDPSYGIWYCRYALVTSAGASCTSSCVATWSYDANLQGSLKWSHSGDCPFTISSTPTVPAPIQHP